MALSRHFPLLLLCFVERFVIHRLRINFKKLFRISCFMLLRRFSFVGIMPNSKLLELEHVFDMSFVALISIKSRRSHIFVVLSVVIYTKYKYWCAKKWRKIFWFAVLINFYPILKNPLVFVMRIIWEFVAESKNYCCNKLNIK